MLILLLLIGGASFAAYAVFAHYQATPATDSVLKRVWTSVMIAGAALGAAIMSWIHNMTAPPT